MIEMDLIVVPIVSGRAGLGRWGVLELTGRRSTRVKSRVTGDFDLPSEVAEDLPQGVLFLADAAGRLLILPYSGEAIACLDLAEGSLVYPIIRLPRIADQGLRMATVRTVPGQGVLHLTEASLCLFGSDATLAWRFDADLLGWSIDAVDDDQITLVTSTWSGQESRQVLSLGNGKQLQRPRPVPGRRSLDS